MQACYWKKLRLSEALGRAFNHELDCIVLGDFLRMNVSFPMFLLVKKNESWSLGLWNL